VDVYIPEVLVIRIWNKSEYNATNKILCTKHDHIHNYAIFTIFHLLQNFQKVIVQLHESANVSVPCKLAHPRLSSSGPICRICHEGAKFC
jgi:hypothetical protein